MSKGVGLHFATKFASDFDCFARVLVLVTCLDCRTNKASCATPHGFFSSVHTELNPPHVVHLLIFEVVAIHLLIKSSVNIKLGPVLACLLFQ